MKTDNLHNEERIKVVRKYDLSFKRVFSRLLITFVLGIVFGIAMIPFMQSAEGLYDMQQAQIGTQNMLRMVALWGLFTSLTTLIVFWKKRFRMVAVFLVGCWILSIAAAVWVSISDRDDNSCKRISMYPIEKEFNRSLDLIAQRMNITDSVGSWLELAFQYKNCLNIQYSDMVGSAEGVFVQNDEDKLQNLSIYLSPDYKSFDDLSIATVLVHELSHVGGYIHHYLLGESLDCYEDETAAFLNEAIFLNSINPEERRSIYARLRDNIDLNPAFQIVLLFDERENESYQACENIRISNLLSEEQFNECFWQSMRNKLEQDIRNNTYYQKQCNPQ